MPAPMSRSRKRAPLRYFLAVRSGNAEAAELLIERGADVNREAKLGLPLTVAVLKNAADHQGRGR